VNYQLKFHLKAKQEYIDSYLWYGLQQNGLEERFKLAVGLVLEKLTRNPQYFRFCKEPFREASIKKFPFTIVFTININSVFIAAIYHSKRNPSLKFRKQYGK